MALAITAMPKASATASGPPPSPVTPAYSATPRPASTRKNVPKASAPRRASRPRVGGTPVGTGTAYPAKISSGSTGAGTGSGVGAASTAAAGAGSAAGAGVRGSSWDMRFLSSRSWAAPGRGPGPQRPISGRSDPACQPDCGASGVLSRGARQIPESGAAAGRRRQGRAGPPGEELCVQVSNGIRHVDSDS